jgi:hypothetical protein
VASQGARCAADYIAGIFRDLGLEGGGPDGSFFQRFPVRMGSILGEGNSLVIQGNELDVQEDWITLGFSSADRVTGSLVYGGPGVSRPGSEDDVYAHLNVEGKILVVEGAPPHGAGGENLAGDFHFKASVAAGRDAAAILILLPEGRPLPDPVKELRPGVDIPAAAVAGPRAQEVRNAAENGSEAIIETSVLPRMQEARNVVALLPGADPTLRRETVIVGAHYDHLGFGGEGSLSPDARAIHNGADDNASGTAALLDVARRLATSDESPARSVLFLAFTGEEKGLWGSGHYVSDPLVPLENTVAMLNMDMVGRLRENTLTVYGTGTAQEWPELLRGVNLSQSQPFDLAEIPDGYGASDHSEFYGADIPVLMLFTNTHSDYHRPEDDWELVNGDGLRRVAAFAADLVREVAGSRRAGAMAVTLVEGAGSPHGAAMAGDSAARPSRGYGAYMGTIPDMTPRDFGVRITGVREESPAEKAGLQGGDVIIQLGGREISDLYAYTYALRDHEPGDEVKVVVLREGQRLTLSAVLGRR